MGSGRRGALFITFEGPDGSGKTTHARTLAETLRREGLPVVATFEPGGTPLGEQLRRLLLGPEGSPQAAAPGGWDPVPAEGAPVPMAEMLLMAADRAQHVERLIRPALEQGQWVICDRYVDSSLAYQGYGAGLDLEQVREVNRWATGGLVPDLTFLLDPGPDGPLGGWPQPESLRHPDWIEDRGRRFWDRVRQGYLALWRQEPHRIHRIDMAGQEPARIDRAILDRIAHRRQAMGEAGQ